MVFVTGGAGLVGSALLKQLLQEKQGPIKALYRTSMPLLLSEEEKQQIEWIKGDVLDVNLLDEIMQDCEEVYHSAAVVSYHSSRREQMYKINIEGTANMVNMALANNIRKFIHVSSVAAIGRLRAGEKINEKTEWTEETNNSHYGKTKFLSEMEIWRGIGEGLNAAIVNPSVILGESNWENGSVAIFKKIYNQFPWYTNGGTGFVDAKDVAAVMIRLMKSDITAERFLLSAEHLSFKELFTKIAAGFGVRAPQRLAQPWMGGIVWRLEALKAMFSKKEPLLTKETASTAQVKTFYDASKVQQMLPGFQFTPIDETIERTCNWLNAYYHL
ncbi:nucleoside-diphosphate-sugar epimerase [Lacibacter cauensis]|uniref:Nucleoside-diphosphate-sugar epimerase n=1 Tax=Lacibacter cauensis TaxID=510947 RepID=A0A562SJQ3_9BACT|nr:NAD-dependent epimerase/dehydratase family protein [Lacibacter cauensis]TWI81485.1 nucleoside-diphosphate-sugar epimerase [Lacibacter cauensis]